MRACPARAALALSAMLTLTSAAAIAQADESAPPEILVTAGHNQERLGSRARTLGTSAASSDTVYFGHSYTDHTGAPGPIVNYWNLYTGTYRPGVNDPNNALWDWDHSTGFGAYANDSLAGWWPFVRSYFLTGGLTLTDNNRPWWAIDQGNFGNYVINQGAGAKRTKGVVGYWHDDAGAGQGSAVTWSPISGSRSAWCGLRQHGDLSAVDLVTGNPYNQSVLEFQNRNDGGTGTNMNFPGYTNQMDQMLYRDVAVSTGQSLQLSFHWRTRLSTSVVITSSTRTGWFDKDPLALTAGNFISSSAAGANAPIDSFLVYIGAPVTEAACTYSDGSTAPVLDPQRRWFSEVLRVNEGGAAPWFRLLGASGHSPADTLSPANLATIAVPSSMVDAILAAPGNDGRVRIVFRVKTNSLGSDSDSRSSGYTSRGHGAAIVDDVIVDTGGGPVVIGDFETPEQGGPGSIDNRPSASALTNWKSTGKPPAIYFHPRALSELTYHELCGPPDSPARSCNIGGVVIAAGNFDDAEHHADRRYVAGREVMNGFMSPTVNLVTPLDGSPNEQGLTSATVNVTDDIYVWYDLYAGMFDLVYSGNAWTYGVQSYPAQQTGNGAKLWGAPQEVPGQYFNPDPECFTDWQPLFGNALIRTSNASGVPDSIRCWLGVNQQCFRYALSLGCNSADGAYFDNVSLAFVDLPVSAQTSAAQAITLGAISANVWDFYNDAFPANETPGLPGTAAFDTCAAWIQTGSNNAPLTSSVLRNDLPGDSMVVSAFNATVTAPDNSDYARVRVDLVFRILPGPGNYQIAAGRTYPPTASMQLLRTPQNQGLAVSPGDPSFWGQLIANPGEFAKGDHFGGTRWDHLTWNSVRCDTAEFNRFPVSGVNVTSGLNPGRYASMIHEQDPRFIALGIPKNKCFLINPASNSVIHSNITCTSVPAWVTSGAPANGYDGNPTTIEFTKIIPDGLLTPGAHVQYFFRKSHEIDPLLSFAMMPDTNFITPQNSEGGNTDGHRWQQFGVLPDRWKHLAFGGIGMACALVVDGNDGRGNERAWVSVMDSLSSVLSSRGSHNGWGGIPDSVDYTGLPVSDPRIAPYVIANRNKQPGTSWDMYGVKGSGYSRQAGSLGSRLANKATGFAAGKDSRQGPTKEMLRAYYRTLIYLSGDLRGNVLGPLVDQGQNDVAIIDDFLRTSGGTSQPRGFFAIGDGFVEAEAKAGFVVAAHTDLLNQTLGLLPRAGSYQSESGNVNSCADLLSTSYITTPEETFGVSNLCTGGSNDLMQPDPAIAEAAAAMYYENAGANGPYVASVVKTSTAGRNWVAFTLGVDLESTFLRFCDNTRGRRRLVQDIGENLFGSMCRFAQCHLCFLDVPGGGARDLLEASLLLRGNVQRTGPTQVVFTSPATQRVRIDLHDVAGRRVRLLADRVFQAGEHTLTWDGTADDGTRAARGVYFLRMQVEGGTRELTGRVVVLR